MFPTMIRRTWFAQRSGRVLPGFANRVLHTHPANLMGFWPLNELNGTIAYDYSGHNYHGTYEGSPLLGQDELGDGSVCPFFDGVDDKVQLPVASLSAALGQWTIGTALLWIKADPALWVYDRTSTLFHIGSADDYSLVYFYTYTVDPPDPWASVYGVGLGVGAEEQDQEWEGDNSFALLACSWSTPGDVSGYRGTSKITYTYINAWARNTIGYAYIGGVSAWAETPVRGHICNAAIWKNVSLTEAEILALIS